MLNKNLDYVKDILDAKGSFTVLTVGDSLTSAEWVHPNYREILEYALKETLIGYASEDRSGWTVPSWGIRFINCGYDGIMSKELLDNLGTNVLKYNPDLTLLMVNSNDSDFKVGINESMQNVKEILRKLKLISSRIIYTSNPASINDEWNKNYEPYINFPVDFFTQSGAEYVNLFEKFKRFDLKKFYTFKSQGNPDLGMKAGAIDWAHPNSLGNAYMAHIVLKEVFGIRFNPEQYIKELRSGEVIMPEFASWEFDYFD